MKKVYVAVCAGCGEPLTRMMVGATVYGKYSDFDLREDGGIDLVYCSECWQRTGQFSDERVDDAVKRKRVEKKINNTYWKNVEKLVNSVARGEVSIEERMRGTMPRGKRK